MPSIDQEMKVTRWIASLSDERTTVPALTPPDKVNQHELTSNNQEAGDTPKTSHKTGVHHKTLNKHPRNFVSPSVIQPSSSPSSILNDTSTRNHPVSNDTTDSQRVQLISDHRNPSILPKMIPDSYESPLHHRQNGSTQSSKGRAPMSHWQSWSEVRIQLRNIPKFASVKDLYDEFAKEGKIRVLEIHEERGLRTGKGHITFRPPPARAFWGQTLYRLNLSKRGSFDLQCQLTRYYAPPEVVSPFGKTRRYPERMDVGVTKLDVGVMMEPNKVASKRTISDQNGLLLNLNLRYEELSIEFPLSIPSPSHPTKPGLKLKDRHELWKLVVPFNQIRDLRRTSSNHSQVRFLMDLELPPKYFRQVPGTQSEKLTTNKWTEKDSWFRQTDVVSDHRKLRSATVSLKKHEPYVDIGRWTSFVVELNMLSTRGHTFNAMQQALQDYNLAFGDFGQIAVVSADGPLLWNILDESQSEPRGGVGIPQRLRLTFDVQYQLEVCISRGILNEHNITREFLDKIASISVASARELLEHIANQKVRVFDPMSIFDQDSTMRTTVPKIPEYCTLSRSVFVTPTTIRINTPTIEISNRIVRQYPEHSDRFIRVRFTDEAPKVKIWPVDGNNQNELYTRIKRTFANGIRIGNRHFIFLAFGNSQFREHGAYFFAPPAGLPREHIRAWMGSFEHIKQVALFASRLGQCFSTTRAISTQPELSEVDDVYRNGFCFSDGVGLISHHLALDIVDHLRLTGADRDVPSVFQFRLGGCKGVLTVWPHLSGQEIHIRETQYKFPAVHEGLEIIRYSQYAAANLNRQIILVLSSLGVPDKIFERKLSAQLSDIDTAMHDKEKAIEVLSRDVDHNQMTLKMADMVRYGFQERNEPFISSLLRLWRAWSKKYLKEKARITIHQGALLLGCMDETGILRGHFHEDTTVSKSLSFDEKIPYLPQVFVQLSKGPQNRPKIINGPMLLARNPSLHPGDIRVVCGVDVQALHHLRDCIVLPRTGDRDVASMCSGGDLDGDDFEVIWDSSLLPEEWNHDPMDYTASERTDHAGDITDNDLTNFFITYMKNDTLPRIAHAHVAIADASDHGVKDARCLELAALHSQAVDFVKTGRPAKMTPDLSPKRWPHFMEKKKPAKQTYHSEKVLGKLFDQVERTDFKADMSTRFDERILTAFNTSDDMLKDAATIKNDYDSSVHRLMAQHAIKTEFEIWSSFVMEHNHVNDFKLAEEIGQISSALKDQFREACTIKAGGKAYEYLAPFVTAMYKVTADEVKRANDRQRENGIQSTPLISFPWLFQDVLGKIVKGWVVHGLQDENMEEKVLASGATANPIDPQLPFVQTCAGRSVTPEGGDDIHTVRGTTHRGDVLKLFESEAGNTKQPLSDQDDEVQGQERSGNAQSDGGKDQLEHVNDVLPTRERPSIYEQFAALGFDTDG